MAVELIKRLTWIWSNFILIQHPTCRQKCPGQQSWSVEYHFLLLFLLIAPSYRCHRPSPLRESIHLNLFAIVVKKYFGSNKVKVLWWNPRRNARVVWRRGRKCEPPSQLENSSDRWHQKAHLDSFIISILGFWLNWTDRKNIQNATQMSVVWFWIRSGLKQIRRKSFMDICYQPSLTSQGYQELSRKSEENKSFKT